MEVLGRSIRDRTIGGSLMSTAFGTGNRPSTPANAEAMEAALQRLSADTRALNRLYIDHVQKRSLVSVPEMMDWLEHPVTVFLRHDQVRVFAVVHEQTIGMADFLHLRNVRFHVDALARKESNAERGPLPNKRTVHAFLTGELISIGDSGRLPDGQQFEPIVYHPLHHCTFVRQESGRPAWEADEVLLVPGGVKVWCPRISETEFGQTGAFGGRR